MAKRTRNRNRNKPASNSAQNFRIDIELDAVVDYMTMLRGFTAHGEFFDDFVSDQLTRFPAFDGSDWENLLPNGQTFETFLNDAIRGNSPTGKKLFDRVRPYDFAYRDLTYLRRNGAQVVIHVPDRFESNIDEIQKWVKKYFPPNSHFKPVRVVALGKEPARKPSDVWVVRSPKSAIELREAGQAFILIDGKENAHIDNVNRVIRWDQAGFLLRHAQLIKHLRDTQQDTRKQKQPIFGPIHPPHRDIFQGQPIQLLLADDALLWIGQQLKSIDIAINNPTSALRFGRKSTETRKQFSGALAKKIRPILEIDRQEVERKARFLTSEIDHKMDQIFTNPDWTSILRTREEQMALVLADLENELRIDPVTGGETNRRRPNLARSTTSESLGDRLLSGDPRIPIILNLNGAEIIHLFSRHWNDVVAQIDETDPASIAGHVAEITIALSLKEGKWKLLDVNQKANGLDSPSIIDSLRTGIQRYVLRNNGEPTLSKRRIDLNWHDLGTGELRTAEVDFVARGPGNNIVIGEVKLSVGKPLSDLQVELREHIVNGGRIINPGFPGVRGKTFGATWREIRIADNAIGIPAPTNNISSITQTL
jgi:hypothetical protein